ncbi:lymphoid-restricted membrane protein isoform X2 [Denticeps clupeoides]|uniref:lymphoid-restricted membrane protein isoform X2 n=1 Tax=Denticeps clupeoides TaxID=299321 RepID=UPI0010A424D3|nr:lymphoid-restricted membrane protein-like isoform X2 [Denticeps clupeoides]
MMGTPESPVSLCCDFVGELGSDGSDEEIIQQIQSVASLESQPILERLGLTSGEEMTEEEVELLRLRLQADESDEVLRRMEACLEALGGSMESVVAAAEMLGAAHQEARVCRAVGLMALHVDHLKRRHTLESSELQESRRLVHRTRVRLFSDSVEDGEGRFFVKQSSQQGRRRVSITLIPTQSQLGDLEAKFAETCKISEDTSPQGPEEGSTRPGSRPQEIPAVTSQQSSSSQVPSESPPATQPDTTSPSQEDQSELSALESYPVRDALRRRQRSAATSPGEEEPLETSVERSSGAGEPNVGSPVWCPLLGGASRSLVLCVLLSITALLCVALLWVLFLRLSTT